MKNMLCRWFGCNAAVVRWLSSNRVSAACSRCGETSEWSRK